MGTRMQLSRLQAILALAGVVGVALVFSAVSAQAKECDARKWRNEALATGITLPEYHGESFGKPAAIDGTIGKHGRIIARVTVTPTGEARDIEVLCAEEDGDYLPGARIFLSGKRIDPAFDDDGRTYNHPGFVLVIDTTAEACDESKFAQLRPQGLEFPGPQSNKTTVKRVPPIMPLRAVIENISGRVIIGFVISKSGDLVDLKSLCSTPPGLFDNAAIKALKQWHY